MHARATKLIPYLIKNPSQDFLNVEKQTQYLKSQVTESAMANLNGSMTSVHISGSQLLQEDGKILPLLDQFVEKKEAQLRQDKALKRLRDK